MRDGAAHDTTAFRELALHLLALRCRGLRPRDGSIELPSTHPGQLPSHFPLVPPLPPGTHLVGSLSTRFNAVILFTTSRPSALVVSFYLDHLARSGWIHRPIGGSYGGFPTVFPPEESVTLFCHTEPHVHLTVTVKQQNRGSAAELQLSYDPSDQRCTPPDEPDVLVPRAYRTLPTLLPPVGAGQTGGRGGRNDNGSYAAAELTTDLGLFAIADHYGQQLDATGWKLRGRGHSQTSIWSTWGLDDPDGDRHQALWFALRIPQATGHYLLYLQASRSDPWHPNHPSTGFTWDANYLARP